MATLLRPPIDVWHRTDADAAQRIPSAHVIHRGWSVQLLMFLQHVGADDAGGGG